MCKVEKPLCLIVLDRWDEKKKALVFVVVQVEGQRMGGLTGWNYYVRPWLFSPNTENVYHSFEEG